MHSDQTTALPVRTDFQNKLHSNIFFPGELQVRELPASETCFCPAGPWSPPGGAAAPPTPGLPSAEPARVRLFSCCSEMILFIWFCAETDSFSWRLKWNTWQVQSWPFESRCSETEADMKRLVYISLLPAKCQFIHKSTNMHVTTQQHEESVAEPSAAEETAAEHEVFKHLLKQTITPQTREEVTLFIN